jgi:hypothetical protein
MHTLYINPDNNFIHFPKTPRMLHVSPLLHEFVLRIVAMPVEYDEKGQDGQIVKAFLGEIDWTPIRPVSLPSLQD